MGMKKMIAKRVLWPAVSMGTAWAAEKAMEKGYRRVRGRNLPVRATKRSSLAWTATTAATAAVVGMMAERGIERVMRRRSKED